MAPLTSSVGDLLCLDGKLYVVTRKGKTTLCVQRYHWWTPVVNRFLQWWN